LFRDLSGFGLSGALSDKLSQLSNLEDLNLQNNEFEDGLPASWHQFEALKHLNLSNNTIRGAFQSLNDDYLDKFSFVRSVAF